MKLKKRNKKSRARGNRTLGYAMKKHKGSGNRGGKGMAGTGKRGDQRKTWVIKYQHPYFGKQGTTSKNTDKTKEKQNKIMNLKEINGKYKAGDIDLTGYKILGDGKINGKYIIKAKSASQSAISQIEKAGGKIIFVDEKGNEIQKSEDFRLSKSKDLERKEKQVKKKEEIKAEEKKEGKKKTEKKEAKAK